MDASCGSPYTSGSRVASEFPVSTRHKGVDVTKNWIGISLAVVALAVSASAAFACDQQAAAADAKDAKGATADAAVAANGATKAGTGCDMPCCAHAKEAVADKNAANGAEAKPCAANDAKGCPKKATATAATAAKAEPAKETAKAEPATTPGTHR
jgi:hypothetical protein